MNVKTDTTSVAKCSRKRARVGKKAMIGVAMVVFTIELRGATVSHLQARNECAEAQSARYQKLVVSNGTLIYGSAEFLPETTSMTHFTMPLSLYMSETLVSMPETATLMEIENTLNRFGISCVPIINDDENCTGVLSRTDLLRIGRAEVRHGSRRNAHLDLPNQRALDVVQSSPVTVLPDAPVAEAAELLVKHHIHRVFVRDPSSNDTSRLNLIGVFSTKEVLAAIRDKRLTNPISEFMVEPVLTIENTASVTTAIERLRNAHVSGLVVVDEDESPIGVFTQVEALEARQLPPETQIEDVMNYAMLCLDVRTPLFRAAGQSFATRARRVLAVKDRKVRGILTGIDFARAANH
jgi:CBS domain-containing protein